MKESKGAQEIQKTKLLIENWERKVNENWYKEYMKLPTFDVLLNDNNGKFEKDINNGVWRGKFIIKNNNNGDICWSLYLITEHKLKRLYNKDGGGDYPERPEYNPETVTFDTWRNSGTEIRDCEIDPQSRMDFDKVFNARVSKCL